MESATPQVLTVSQLNTYIKSVLDADYRLKHIFLVGEISNFNNHVRSGHFYLTLKEKDSQIKAVMFHNNAVRLPFLPEDGMKVICFGSVSVYAASGQYQFYIDNMQPDGLGALSLAFEQLKERLGKEGLFDDRYKKPLPEYPKKIGVATSPTGAAFQDVCNVLRRRWPQAELLLAPCLVQGNSAPLQICNALRELDSRHPDVILLVRGGGSMEDLWCFNDERVARTVFDLHTPVVTGVGHETDFTIVDFVSDLRAPTPSAAAELCTPDRLEEMEKLLLMQSKLHSSMNSYLKNSRTKVGALASSTVLRSLTSLINERRLTLDAMTDKMTQLLQGKVLMEQQRLHRREEGMQRTVETQVQKGRMQLSICAGKLDAFAPLKVLARGYSLSFNGEGRVVQSITAVHPQEDMTVQVSDGKIHCRVESVEQE